MFTISKQGMPRTTSSTLLHGSSSWRMNRPSASKPFTTWWLTTLPWGHPGSVHGRIRSLRSATSPPRSPSTPSAGPTTPTCRPGRLGFLGRQARGRRAPKVPRGAAVGDAPSVAMRPQRPASQSASGTTPRRVALWPIASSSTFAAIVSIIITTSLDVRSGSLPIRQESTDLELMEVQRFTAMSYGFFTCSAVNNVGTRWNLGSRS